MCSSDEEMLRLSSRGRVDGVLSRAVLRKSGEYGEQVGNAGRGHGGIGIEQCERCGGSRSFAAATARDSRASALSDLHGSIEEHGLLVWPWRLSELRRSRPGMSDLSEANREINYSLHVNRCVDCCSWLLGQCTSIFTSARFSFVRTCRIYFCQTIKTVK